MPHFRNRHVTDAFRKLCKLTPIVGIFGHRQVGKTTFLEANSKDYYSLDDEREVANSDPKGFLSRLKADHSAIDECQLAPPLFPALKSWVHKKKTPGQFLLSGSVRFTSRRAIRESLTGRISTVELFPFVLSEIRKDRLPDLIPWALKSRSFLGFKEKTTLVKKEKKERLKTYQAYLEKGGFPGLFLLREQQARDRLMQDILRTILDRDIRLVYETPLPYSDLYGLCSELARHPLEAVQFKPLQRRLGLSSSTIKHLIDAFEAIYLLRKLPIEGGGRKGFSVWFEDQFEQNHLAGHGLSPELKRAGLAFRNARAQFEYRLGSTPIYFRYLTRAGASIPLGIRQNQDVLGILPLKSIEDFGRAERASISSFLKTYNHSKVIVTVEDDVEAVLENKRTLIAPVVVMY